MSVYTGPRTESYRVDLLDSSDRLIGALDGVLSGRVEQNLYAEIRGGLSLSVARSDPDWQAVRLRPVVTVNGEETPLGVYLPASPKRRRGAEGLRTEVAAWDKTLILAEDKIPESFAVAAGDNLTDAIEDVILATGETALAVEPSGLVAPSMIVWRPGTSRLRIVNDLAAAVNYFSVWADGSGIFRVEPYRSPSYRPLAWTFAEGAASIHLPDFDLEQDTAGVPNRVIRTTAGDDETPPLVAVAENTDPASRYSYPSRGRWIADEPKEVEAASQEVLDAIAARDLVSASSPSRTIAASHAFVPLAPNDVVRFVSDGVDLRAVVENLSLDLRPGSLVSAKWREVTS